MNHPNHHSDVLVIEVAASRRFRGINRRRLAVLVRSACDRLDVRSGMVSIYLAHDEEMGRLHERYKGQSGPTDVLAFPLQPTRRAPGSKGRAATVDVEIVIGAQVAQREARARGLAVEAEALLYVVHGLLHCLGEDDHSPASARRMRARESRVLRAVGLGRVFDAPARLPGTATIMQRRRRRSIAR